MVEPMTHMDTEVEALVGARVAASASRNLQDRRIKLVAFSGKMGSGKDTLALRVNEILDLGAHLAFADQLRHQINQMIAVVQSTSLGAALRRVSEEQGVGYDDALGVCTRIGSVLREDSRADAYTRTDAMRGVLQYWGTEVRRRLDNDYWVKLGLSAALGAAAAGRSVHFTDVRFPNEASWAKRAGFTVVRIDIDGLIQRQRLSARDGVPPDEEKLTHDSEVALDDYQGFDLRVDNSGDLDTTLGLVLERLK